MSTRLGMADGRCATINVSNRILNDDILQKTFGIDKFDNFNYRMKLQESAPEDVVPGAVCSLIKYNKPILDIQ